MLECYLARHLHVSYSGIGAHPEPRWFCGGSEPNELASAAMELKFEIAS